MDNIENKFIKHRDITQQYNSSSAAAPAATATVAKQQHDNTQRQVTWGQLLEMATHCPSHLDLTFLGFRSQERLHWQR